MVFILRAAFWIAVVAAFVPAGFSAPVNGAFAREANALFSAPAADGVQAARTEASQFCSDRPEACEVGERFAAFTGLVADVAAHRAEDWLETQGVTPAETFEDAEIAAVFADAAGEPAAR